MKHALALILSLLAAGAATGQDTDPDGQGFCDMDGLAPERLLGGPWEMTVTPFRVDTGGTPTYFGQGGQETVNFDHEGSEWIMFGARSEFPVVRYSQVLDGADDWRWPADEVISPNSSDDLRILYDCDINRFPRLEGYAETTSVDGYTIAHTVRLVVLQAGIIVGFWSWEGGPAGARVERVGGLRLFQD